LLRLSAVAVPHHGQMAAAARQHLSRTAGMLLPPQFLLENLRISSHNLFGCTGFYVFESR
jgi:hypothetical protein